MNEATRLSGTAHAPVSASVLAQEALGQHRLPRSPVRIALSGSEGRRLGAVALHLLGLGHQLVLVPRHDDRDGYLPLAADIRIHVDENDIQLSSGSRSSGADGAWRAAMYTSGSTGSPQVFGFTLDQLGIVAYWYTRIYGVTSSSVIVTSLPVAYNFTFVAGVYLAAVTGARLHLARSPQVSLQEAARLAPTADQCVVLANPVVLHLADHSTRLPDNVLVDSGGAPLSTPTIAFLRYSVGDVREGYGLTETASLTHFDAEGTADSLGTVGSAMPGVRSWIVPVDGKPRLALESPVIGVELDAEGVAAPARDEMLTGDLATVDPKGRLRLLGRHDDYCVGGFWPRDTLDLIGTAIGPRCALVRHPSPEQVRIRVLDAVTANLAASVRTLVGGTLLIPEGKIDIDGVTGGLLHSHKLPRATGQTG